MSGEITWVRSLVFSNYFLNCFMIVCGFLEVFPVNWRCKTREIPIYGKNGKIVILITKL